MKKLLSLLFSLSLFFILLHSVYAKSWTYQKSGTVANLNAVFFVNKDVGWAVGDAGTILFTKDGGERWIDISTEDPTSYQPVPYAPYCSFKTAWFVSPREGWVAGQVVLPVMEPGATAPFPVKFGFILHTEDAGGSWEIQYPRQNSTGETALSEAALKSVSDIYFLTPQIGWAVGDGSVVLKTEDGGNTWKELPIGFSVIPEIRLSLTSTQWISPNVGWIAGYEYDMNSPANRYGIIASTRDGGKNWKKDVYPNNLPQLNDIEIKVPFNSVVDCTHCFYPPAWSVGMNGVILHLTESGWKYQNFAWPLSLPLPQFNATEFSDQRHGWIVGFRKTKLNPSYEDINPDVMVIFHTSDAGERWNVFPFGDAGKLNDVSLVGATDAWAVGDKGVILHYGNSVPEICRAWADPELVEAGEEVGLFVSVEDLDGHDDIEKVTVDMRGIGGEVVELDRAWADTQDRRCVLYAGKAPVPNLASYGLHRLPVKVADKDGAVARGEIEVFIVTCSVKIGDTWAKPNPVYQGDEVLLEAKVKLICPKDGEEEGISFDNYGIKIDKVMVNITQLLDVDCGPDTDCQVIAEMTDPDGDGIYTYLVKEVTGGPGKYELPVRATDSLGHTDRSLIRVGILSANCRFDYKGDGDVDGLDLALFAKNYQETESLHLREFASEFGRDNCF